MVDGYGDGVEERELDIMYRHVAEAGVRLPFDISDLRRWAAGRRRVPKGHGEPSGEFLPEVGAKITAPVPRLTMPAMDTHTQDRVDLPSGARPRPRLTPPEPVLEPLDLPEEGVPARRADPWKVVGHEKPKPLAAYDAKVEKEAVAAKAEAEAAKGATALRLTQNASNDANTAAAGAIRAVERTKAARVVAHEEALQKQWVKDIADDAVVEAEAALAVALENQGIANAARIRAQTNKSSARIVGAEQRKAEAAVTTAREAREIAEAAQKKAEKAAGATDQPVVDKDENVGGIPRPPFVEEKQIARYNQLEPGYRFSTTRELFERWGNSPMWSGMWIALDPDHYKPLQKFRPVYKDGKVGEYAPRYRYDQERKKWRRIEALTKIIPDIRDVLVGKARSPKTDKTTLDNTLAAMVILETGARPGDPKNESFPKDKTHPLYRKYGHPERQKVPTYGATTLLKEHATIVRDAEKRPVAVKLKFLGKSGVTNDITVRDPDLVRHLVKIKNDRTIKPGARMFPGADSTGLGKILGPYGFDLKDLADKSSPAEDAAEEGEPAEEPVGKFKTKDLRTVQANTYAAEYFQRIMDAHQRIPRTKEEFIRWMNAASYAASQDLGNTHKAFTDNYLSMVPFMDVIHRMIEVEKAKSRNRGPVDPEDYWIYGSKTLFPGGMGPSK